MGKLDILSASFADNFNKLLDQSSISGHNNRRRSDVSNGLSGVQTKTQQQPRRSLTQNSAGLFKRQDSSEKLAQFNQQNTKVSIKMINKDISMMNEIKEVDEQSPRRLKRRFKAMNRMRKSKEDAVKIKKAQLIANKRNQERLFNNQQRRTDGTMTESGLNDRDVTSLGSSTQNPAVSSPRHLYHKPARLPSEELSSSFKPHSKGQDSALAQLASASRVRRNTTILSKGQRPPNHDGQEKEIQMSALQSPPAFSRFDSADGHVMRAFPKPTPQWPGNRSKASAKGTSSRSSFARQQRSGRPFASHTFKEDKSPAQAVQPKVNLSHLDREHPQLDMFSEDDDFRLTSEERRGIDLLKRARAGNIIHHADLKDLQFAPLSMIDSKLNLLESSIDRASPNLDFTELDGRWLADGENQIKLISSSSAARIEDAKERRLRLGFQQKRLVIGGSKDALLGQSSSNQPNQSRQLKSLGPKLEHVLLQLPPPTVFDFNRSLRRPVSARVGQSNILSRSLQNFQKLQKIVAQEKKADQVLNERQIKQTEELRLDYQSAWGMPFKIFSEAGDKDSENAGGRTSKGKGKKGGKRLLKGKTVALGSEEEEEFMDEQQRADIEKQRILEQIELERKQREVINLWPDPSSKIFLKQKQETVKAKKKQNSPRQPFHAAKPSLASHHQLSLVKPQKQQQQSNANEQFSYQLKLKLDKLAIGGARQPSQSKLPNSDLELSTVGGHSPKGSSQSSRPPSKLSKQGGGLRNKPIARKVHGSRMRLNADLSTTLQKSISAAKPGKGHKPRAISASTNFMQKRSNRQILVGEEAKKVNQELKLVKDMKEQVRAAASYKAARTRSDSLHMQPQAIRAIKRPCLKHKMFQCACQQYRDMSMSFIQMEKDLIPFKMRSAMLRNQGKGLPNDAASNGITWKEWKKTKDGVLTTNENTMIKQDELLFARALPKSKYDEGDFDFFQLVEAMKVRKPIRLYDVDAIQAELEELTDEDEDDVENFAEDQIDVWHIRRKIKQSLKRHFEPPKTTIDMFKYGRVLGKGAYGKVNVCLQKLSGKLCAVKTINLEKVKMVTAKDKIESEKTILKELRHPHIAKLYEYIRDENLGYDMIYMEICTGGDLLSYLRRRKRLEESYAKLFLKQLMKALGYLHEKGIAHRDIKLENILLSNLGTIKVCDFGVAMQLKKIEKLLVQPSEAGIYVGEKQISEADASKQDVLTEGSQLRGTPEPTVITLVNEERFEKVLDCCGTPAYMAPEVIKAGQEGRKYKQKLKEWTHKKPRTTKAPKEVKVEEFGYGLQCDIWSAGVLLYALVYGQLPFRGITVREIKEKVLNANKAIMLKDGVSRKCQSLIKSMLTRDPKQRPTVDQVLADPWFSDTPEQEDIVVFNESERASMIKQYFFSENPDHWYEYIEVDDKECKDLLRFSDGNLRTQESDQELKNESEGSDILAPANSCQEEEKLPDKIELVKGYTMQLPNVFMYLKKDARQADSKYELDHNDLVDNGVYKTGDIAEIRDLATKTGVRDVDAPGFANMRQLKQESVDSTVDIHSAEQNILIQKFSSQRQLLFKQSSTNVGGGVEEELVEREPIIEPNNKFAEAITVRTDLLLRVERFGYKVDDIEKSIVSNLANHQATTYYLLEQDHERIC